MHTYYPGGKTSGSSSLMNTEINSQLFSFAESRAAQRTSVPPFCPGSSGVGEEQESLGSDSTDPLSMDREQREGPSSILCPSLSRLHPGRHHRSHSAIPDPEEKNLGDWHHETTKPLKLSFPAPTPTPGQDSRWDKTQEPQRTPATRASPSQQREVKLLLLLLSKAEFQLCLPKPLHFYLLHPATPTPRNRDCLNQAGIFLALSPPAEEITKPAAQHCRLSSSSATHKNTLFFLS